MRGSSTGIFETALARRLFTAAEVAACRCGKRAFSWRHREKPRQDVFDLASLTKPLCTALLLAMAHEQGKIGINDPVGRYLATKTLRDVTLLDLLNHVSPLAAWRDFSRTVKHPSAYAANQEEILASILNDGKSLRNKDKGRHKTLYSDLGYIVLGAILEKIHGDELSAVFAKKIARPLGLAEKLFFVPLGKRRRLGKKRFVPAETCAWRGRLIQGEVMDENASVMGGVSGHAGLFGTLTGVCRLLSELRAAYRGKSALLRRDTFAAFFIPDRGRLFGSRVFAGGFDTPTKPGSQSGRFFSKSSIGHLGYSGTSFWWDLEQDVQIVMLTNRCAFGRDNPGFAKWRPKAHDAMMTAITKRDQSARQSTDRGFARHERKN